MMLLGQNNQSSMVNFAQIPVTNEVKLKQNFDLLSNLLIGTSGKGSHSIFVIKLSSVHSTFSPDHRTGFGSLILLSVVMLLSSIVYFYIAVSNGPSCMHELDAPRKSKMTNKQADT